MSDTVDLANDNQDLVLNADVLQRRHLAAQIPIGEPGECNKCGNESKRLVGGNCAPCRDRYKLP